MVLAIALQRRACAARQTNNSINQQDQHAIDQL
jgi:hypothetical protein